MVTLVVKNSSEGFKTTSWIFDQSTQSNEIVFDPIEIQTNQAPQNDRLNLSFLKDFNVVGEKWPERVVKWPFLSLKFSGFFLQNCKKREIIFIMFFVLAFDPIRFLIC